MDFVDALTIVKQGGKVRRSIWENISPNLSDSQLELVHLDDHQGIQVMPMLMVRRTSDNPQIWRPFTGSTYDLLAEDWEIVE